MESEAVNKVIKWTQLHGNIYLIYLKFLLTLATHTRQLGLPPLASLFKAGSRM